MKETVLDVLMYLFENYQHGEFSDTDNQDTLRDELLEIRVKLGQPRSPGNVDSY